jgi:competence protein ComEC
MRMRADTPGHGPGHKQFNQPMTLQRPAPCGSLRTMPYMAAAAAGGAACAAAPCRLLLVPAATLLICFLCCVIRFQNRWLDKAIPAIFLIAAFRAGFILIPAECQADELDGKTGLLQGVVCEILYKVNGTNRVLVLQKNGIKIALAGPENILTEGMVVAAQVKFSRPDARRNPGGFDESAWLRGKGVFLEAGLATGDEIRSSGWDPAYRLACLSRQIRESLFRQFADLLGTEKAALLSGLLAGDDSQLPDAVVSDFQKSGLSHLTSASGSNVAYILLPLSIIMKKGKTGRRLRIGFMLAAIVGFGILTGWPVSVTRAVLMSAIVLSASWLRRKSDPLSVLCMAAGLMIIMNPLSVLETGFWLSAASSGSLVLLSGSCTAWLRTRCPALPGFLASGIAASLCSQAALLPLTAALSREISLAGLIANVPAVPLAAAIMLASALLMPPALVLQAVFPAGASFLYRSLAQPAGIMLKALLEIARIAGQAGRPRLFTAHLGFAFWVFWALMLAGWVSKNNQGALSMFIRKHAVICRKLKGSALLASLLAMVILQGLQPSVQVWFFDVGQGDAILIHSRDGCSILIDGGKPGSGRKVISPALDALGIGKINLAVATHGHADHCGGLIELIDDGRISQISVPSGFFGQSGDPASIEQELTGELQEAVLRNGIRVSEIKRNDTIALGSLVSLKVLSPDPDNKESDVIGAKLSGNERALILLALLAGCKLLLTADCTKETEQELLDLQSWPAADFLKVAHHGSKMTTSDEFLDAVRPVLSMISVGPNLYGHPSGNTLDRLKKAESRILRTDRQGAVLLTVSRSFLGKKSWRAATMLP